MDAGDTFAEYREMFRKARFSREESLIRWRRCATGVIPEKMSQR
jgi:hypothetical protein